jgi:outer membrane lipoprotein-sorting protein
LIRKNVDLTGNIEVSAVERAAGVLRITVQEQDGGAAGAVTLVFSDQPLALRQWAVTDAQGITTEVTLLNAEYGGKVPDKVFDYSDLDIHGFRGRDNDR